MKRALIRNVSLCAYNRLLSPPTFFNPNPNFNKSLISLSSISSKIRFFSSEDDSVNKTLNSQKKDVPVGVEDVSDKELKMRIEKYFEGDEEAIPLIFEAILRRKLVGKHDETDDDKLLAEIRPKSSPDNVQDRDFDSDSDQF